MQKTFTKEERISSRRLIKAFATKSSAFFEFPFRIKLMFPEIPQAVPAQILISVPKRNFKRAVDRNLIKRRIREAYRLNNAELKASLLRTHRHLAFMVVYNSREILPFEHIQQKIILILQRLMKENEKVTG